MKRGFIIDERGQVLVLVALSLLVLLGMLALALDGGFAYANRRSAQNAADAAALAGGRQLCIGSTNAAAIAQAEKYATENNTASFATAKVTGQGFNRIIDVTATITYPTFIAGLLGAENLDASAVASAGCANPCDGVGVLPVAWSCSPPITATEFDESCNIKYGTETVTATTEGEYYLIMDSKDLNNDLMCKEPPNNITQTNRIDCDLDNDGVDDALSSGNRSWLDLDGGGGGSSELVNWINGGYPGLLRIHTWIPGNTGTTNNVFQAAAAKVGKKVKIPVFNSYCDQDPRYDSPDNCVYHNVPQDPDFFTDTIKVGAGGSLYYHIITFSSFKITCVDAPPGPVPSPLPPAQHCPIFQSFIDANRYDRVTNPTGILQQGDIQKLKSIEGYFVKDTPAGLTGDCGANIGGGTYTVYLRK